jgi:hypothetical protein
MYVVVKEYLLKTAPIRNGEQSLLLKEMTKITNSIQYHKSYGKYKSENGRTRTSEYIRGGIRCHGGVSIPCRSITPAVTRDTVSRWIKMMKLSGVNTDVIGWHSVRSASVSKAKSATVPVDEILRKAEWTYATTFSKFYI